MSNLESEPYLNLCTGHIQYIYSQIFMLHCTMLLLGLYIKSQSQGYNVQKIMTISSCNKS